MSQINSQTTSIEAIRANRLKMKQQLKNFFPKTTSQIQLFQQVDSIFCQHMESKKKSSEEKINFKASLISTLESSKKEIKKKQKFQDIYILKQKLGEGAQAVVYRCENRLSGQSFAVKITRTSSPQVIQTIQDSYLLLKNLDNENIIKAYRLFVDQESSICHLVLQLCEYSDLRESIKKQIFYSYSQNQILSVIKRIVNAVDYLQQKGVCHRDIKPENILYNPESGQLKLVDFDISKLKKIEEQTLQMWTNTGSLHYRAPQSFDGVYDGKVDLWSTGIVAYELFSGQVPFKSASQNKNIKKIVEEEINYSCLPVTQPVKIFLKKLLEKNPEKRATSKQILELEVFKQKIFTSPTSSLCSTANEDQEHSPYSSCFSFVDSVNASKKLFTSE